MIVCLDKEGKTVANGFVVVFSKVLYHFENRSYYIKSRGNNEIKGVWKGV